MFSDLRESVVLSGAGYEICDDNDKEIDFFKSLYICVSCLKNVGIFELVGG